MGAVSTGVPARNILISFDREAAARAFRSPVVRLALLLSGLTALALLVTLLWPTSRNGEAAVPTKAADRLDLVASVIAYELHQTAGSGLPTPEQVAAVQARLPPLALSDGRRIYVADGSGRVVASSFPARGTPHFLSDLLTGDGEPVGSHRTVLQTRLYDGTGIIAAFRSVGPGHVAVVQPRASLPIERPLALYQHEAFAAACALALAGLGIGCVRYREHARRATLARRRIASRLDTSLTHGRCGVWDWDTTRNRISWSASMYELLGYEPRGEHLSAGEVVAMLHPDDGGLRTLVNSLGLGSSGAAPLDRDLRVRKADGGWLWLRIKGEAKVDPADGSRHVIGLATDVTAERSAADRRDQADHRLHEAVEAISEAFVLWDPAGRLVLCNSKFLKLHGLPEGGAAAGTHVLDVMARGHAPLSETPVALADASREPGTRVLETELPDGRWFHVSEKRTRDGGTVSVGTDVTDLKRKEAELRASERHLRGSLRASETAAQCYAAAAERNYEANVAKTEFLARMSHELRTPLNAILGFSDVMRQRILGPLDDRYVGYASGIHASGVKLLEIIDGILQMSRIEKGQFTLSPTVLLLNEAVAEALEAVREDVTAKDVAVELDLPTPILVQADEQALREILVQLVRNAVKFSPCEARVRVRARMAGASINIYVEDAGVGILPEVLTRLGQPFAQVDPEYSRVEGGAGLGLAIAHALVEMHGGRLKLRSQHGIGTIALVHLPKVQSPANDGAPDPSSTYPLLVAAE